MKQVNYWYVDKSGKNWWFRHTCFYAEILTKYKDGKLIYASVEPGSYSYSNKNAVNLDKVEELDDLSMFSNLKDLNQYHIVLLKWKYQASQLQVYLS